MRKLKVIVHMQQMEFSFITGGNVKWYKHFKFGVFFFFFFFFTKLDILTQKLHFSIFAQMCWKLCPHKNLHTNIIHNCQNLEATKISFSNWINCLTSRQYYPALKRNELSSYEKTWRNFKYKLLSKQANLKRIHTAWFWL